MILAAGILHMQKSPRQSLISNGLEDQSIKELQLKLKDIHLIQKQSFKTEANEVIHSYLRWNNSEKSQLKSDKSLYSLTNLEKFYLFWS
jgi:TolB-like protein